MDQTSDSETQDFFVQARKALEEDAANPMNKGNFFANLGKVLQPIAHRDGDPRVWTLRLASINETDDVFTWIKEKKKNIETRAINPDDHPSYAEIKRGDRLDFFSSTGELVARWVTSVCIYPSVIDMAMTEKLYEIIPGGVSPDELEAIYARFPGYPERIAAHGIIAIHMGDIVGPGDFPAKSPPEVYP